MSLRSPYEPQPPRAPACAGPPPSVVFARHAPRALPAPHACGRCPIRALCEEAACSGRRWFDFVRAGRPWRNGRVVAAAPAPGLSA
ncbi:hypothetical protein [Actinacidiphila glaucinigra]|uniref:hypothetical protein n=1 Tax=Actinacidiphila glaucinigra TaxID=235986 RepID=UPI002E34DC98|nr:hypothetical protein [Actinacidiphila glaucinigra]